MVAIKDMEIPSCCGRCDFSKPDMDDGGYYCTRQRIDIRGIAYKKSAYELHGEWHDKENCPFVEIVSCKDCKGTEHDSFCFHKTGKLKGHSFCDVRQVYVKENDFCSRGERRE